MRLASPVSFRAVVAALTPTRVASRDNATAPLRGGSVVAALRVATLPGASYGRPKWQRVVPGAGRRPAKVKPWSAHT